MLILWFYKSIWIGFRPKISWKLSRHKWPDFYAMTLTELSIRLVPTHRRLVCNKEPQRKEWEDISQGKRRKRTSYNKKEKARPSRIACSFPSINTNSAHPIPLWPGQLAGKSSGKVKQFWSGWRECVGSLVLWLSPAKEGGGHMKIGEERVCEKEKRGWKCGARSDRTYLWNALWKDVSRTVFHGVLRCSTIARFC